MAGRKVRRPFDVFQNAVALLMSLPQHRVCSRVVKCMFPAAAPSPSFRPLPRSRRSRPSTRPRPALPRRPGTCGAPRWSAGSPSCPSASGRKRWTGSRCGEAWQPCTWLAQAGRLTAHCARGSSCWTSQCEVPPSAGAAVVARGEGAHGLVGQLRHQVRPEGEQVRADGQDDLRAGQGVR